MFDTLAYAAFFCTLSFMIGSIAQTVIVLVLTYGQIVGRGDTIQWNFKPLGINLMVWSGLTAFLWHYNFGG